mmetsp:Transcript_50967/g.129447  ORF Transcript_50967/g.129447 Transcript_50967/m.129447 type:complete len:227 (+) Transcript_50967:887-1567(+)
MLPGRASSSLNPCSSQPVLHPGPVHMASSMASFSTGAPQSAMPMVVSLPGPLCPKAESGRAVAIDGGRPPPRAVETGVGSRQRDRLRSRRFTARTTASSVACERLCSSVMLLIALPCLAVLSETPASESSSSADLSPISEMIRALPSTTCMPSRSSRHCAKVSRCSKSSMTPSRISKSCSKTLRCERSSCAIWDTSSLSSDSSPVVLSSSSAAIASAQVGARRWTP